MILFEQWIIVLNEMRLLSIKFLSSKVESILKLGKSQNVFLFNLQENAGSHSNLKKMKMGQK